MPITFGRCQRCGFPIGYDNVRCEKCGKIDNDFCPSCHWYNHKNNPAYKLGAMDDIKRAQKWER